MKLSKFVKNKDNFQIVITLIFMFLIFLLEFKIINNIVTKVDSNFAVESEQVTQAINNFNVKLEKINNYFLVINPSVKILNNYNKINSIFNLIKIIFINLIFLILFILVGKKYYLKNILKNNNNFYLKKINKNNLEKKSKKLNKRKSYIKKEFKILFKNPIFFMQCIFPTVILMFSIVIIVIVTLPNIQMLSTTDLFGENIDFSVNLNVICTVLGIIQMIFTMSNISISSISREGKNAVYIKFLPIDLYKQFIYKSMPQIFVNMILIFIITVLIKLVVPSFELIYLIFLFILANLLNILNSNLMVVVDLYRPNLNWNADYEAIKNNNKLFQYTLTVIIILLLVYFHKIFSELDLFISCLLIILILVIIIFIINKIIKINIKKLFEKIN